MILGYKLEQWLSLATAYEKDGGVVVQNGGKAPNMLAIRKWLAERHPEGDSDIIKNTIPEDRACCSAVINEYAAVTAHLHALDAYTVKRKILKSALFKARIREGFWWLVYSVSLLVLLSSPILFCLLIWEFFK